MTEQATIETYGALIQPATLRIERLLPGPIERVWAYLTQSDLRRRWLAAGDMELREGAAFELVWRNDELTQPPGARPEGWSGESRMASRMLTVDPPRRFAISWGAEGEVAFELAPRGESVLLTLIHRRLPDRATMLNVAAGWHAHLDVLAARASGREPESFWDAWRRLRADYERRLPE